MAQFSVGDNSPGLNAAFRFLKPLPILFRTVVKNIAPGWAMFDPGKPVGLVVQRQGNDLP